MWGAWTFPFIRTQGPSLNLFILEMEGPLKRCRLDESCFLSVVLERTVEGLRLLVVKGRKSRERSSPYC